MRKLGRLLLLALIILGIGIPLLLLITYGVMGETPIRLGQPVKPQTVVPPKTTIELLEGAVKAAGGELPDRSVQGLDREHALARELSRVKPDGWIWKWDEVHSAEFSAPYTPTVGVVEVGVIVRPRPDQSITYTHRSP